MKGKDQMPTPIKKLLYAEVLEGSHTAGTGQGGPSQQILQVRKAAGLEQLGSLHGNLKGPKPMGWVCLPDSTVNPFDGQISNPIQFQ